MALLTLSSGQISTSRTCGITETLAVSFTTTVSPTLPTVTGFRFRALYALSNHQNQRRVCSRNEQKEEKWLRLL